MPDELYTCDWRCPPVEPEPVGFTLADVRRLYMRLWLRHAHEGHPAPDVPWSAEDDAALRACASVVKEKNDAK
jgi:hypothetical protein